MPKTIDWDFRIGRRVRLRDLHVLIAVVQCGSMAKAATKMGVTQSAVSQMIADLEHATGARLLDRSPLGVEPTVYGSALLRRGRAAFDELKQGIQEIEFLADATVGHVRVGCSESISASILLPVVERFYRQNPRAVIDVDDVNSGELTLLRDRAVDLVVARSRAAVPGYRNFDDLDFELLFKDDIVIAAGAGSRWGRRRKIDLVELANEPWILAAPDTWNYVVVAEAFRARGLKAPNVVMRTFSVHLRINLLAASDSITALPRSVLRFYADRFSLKALPVDFPNPSWPVEIATLKNRTLGPMAQRFIECARHIAKSFAE
jgi:DNA-binding transcriptional LysR family regulator